LPTVSTLSSVQPPCQEEKKTQTQN
jgi:hypothetical protein